jgi:hypothetical protein
VAGGEGMLGIQGAFPVLEVRTMIASLWKVNDTTTRNLMGRGYGCFENPMRFAAPGCAQPRRRPREDVAISLGRRSF